VLKLDIAYGYAEPVTHSLEQTIGLVFVLLHFVKRELETIYIHRFSNATVS
jgi:very-long-chain enoyl-CoA reductase